MSAALLYALAGVALFVIGVAALILQAHLLRKILAFNVMGSGVFLVLVGFGAGLTWGSAAIKWDATPIEVTRDREIDWRARDSPSMLRAARETTRARRASTRDLVRFSMPMEIPRRARAERRTDPSAAPQLSGAPRDSPVRDTIRRRRFVRWQWLWQLWCRWALPLYRFRCSLA